jgi:hypothetical protein
MLMSRGGAAALDQRFDGVITTGDGLTENCRACKEDQPYARILQEGLESIDAAVSAPVRNGKGRIVKTSDESCAIALRRHINRAERIG